MKILTNWSVPAKAPMKYVRKTAMATMMLAASAVGMTSCDSFTKSKVPDISYEVHEGMIDRLNSNEDDMRAIFTRRGLYGGTLYNQMWKDAIVFTNSSIGLANLSVGKDADASLSFRDGSWDLSHSYTKLELLKRSRREMDEALFSNGEPTWQECSSYLDRKVASLDFLSQRDYENYQSDVEAFEKSQKKHDEFAKADLLAYKQFILDCLVMTNGLKECGLLDSYECREYLEDKLNNTSSYVLCPMPN